MKKWPSAPNAQYEGFLLKKEEERTKKWLSATAQNIGN
jgi:hypothetical protein